MKISKAHSNCKPQLLIYDIGNDWLARFKNVYKGHLYDLGCGEMPYKDWLLNYVNHYTGVDWGSTRHELKADIRADLNEPLFIDSEVPDAVMEHLRTPQVFLNAAHRILKRWAIILQVPFMWWVHEALYDYYRYTCYGMKYMFEKARFTGVTVYSQKGFWVKWTLRFNYQSPRLIRGPWVNRKAMALLMRCILAVDQRVAPWLKKYWKCECETAGYFVVANKA